MIRHWRQSTFLLLALFALVACSGAAPDAESTSVEVPSMAPSLLTSSPEPSATPFPTATALLTPTPQPRLTSTPEPTATPKPTEIPPSPTPEQSIQAWGVWPSQAEINAALQAEAPMNNYPLQLDEWGVPLPVLRGIATNPHFRNNVVIGDRFEITIAYNLFFDSTSNPESKIALPLSVYDREEQMFIVFAGGSAMPGRVPSELTDLVFESTFSSYQKPLETRLIYFTREEFTNPPLRHEGGMYQPDVVALIQDALGITEADIESFRNTGDISHLPLIDGERWLFPSLTSN